MVPDVVSDIGVQGSDQSAPLILALYPNAILVCNTDRARMDAMRVQATAMAGQSRRMTEPRRLEAALLRLGAGDYGFCVACGEEIAPKRVGSCPTRWCNCGSLFAALSGEAGSVRLP